MTARAVTRCSAATLAALCVVCTMAGLTPAADRPNIILMMADDLGWGDVGFNGGKIIRTPHLDAMAASGLRFTRFYSAAPVCSPTRGSCLTGRHPHRYGVYHANVGHLRSTEHSLASILRKRGYATGHFGKWHLGTLSADYSPRGPKRQPARNFASPGSCGFDTWFSTEHAVATWDPYDRANKHGHFKWDERNFYWRGGEPVTGGLAGDDSRIIMDEAIPFMRSAAKANRPFFAVIWFHAPHAPVVGGPKYLQQYESYPEAARHYYACVTALDEQVGRLRATLRKLQVADNTMVWFCSDNGPARQGNPRSVGSAGPFRGFKASLWEGGVRVPAVLEWPARIKQSRSSDVAAVTSDYLPTILDVIGEEYPDDRTLDGLSLLPLIAGKWDQRPVPIAFQSRKWLALTDHRHKLSSRDRGKTWQLYDLLDDPSETRDIAAEHPQVVTAMRARLEAWLESCHRDDRG